MAYDLNKLVTLGQLRSGLKQAKIKMYDISNELRDLDIASLINTIGEIPEGSTSDNVIDYIDEKTTVATDEEVVGMLDEVFGTNA